MEKGFEGINHQILLDQIIAPARLKRCLKQCLKIGVVKHPEYPKQGTPQGRLLSPLLANITLNGIEQIHPLIRYADSIIFILKPEDSENEVLDQIKAFLKVRGLNISQKKTKTKATTSGFNFLGWHFKVLGSQR
uniref:Putative reverse transcriptase n=1 Tax=Sarcinofilum mucosum TaxID=141643 RepID=A0A1W6EGE4_SARMC|nr:putative reverse transcriptase [Sarcinofilum mucosum]ARK14459.1 putative reverse transcriptase [Sarcinofilum mucosum]